MGRPPNELRVAWRAVALGSIAVSVSLLVGLVTVVGVTNSDVLATTAIVLAILAFVVQLVVFIAQLLAAERQLERGEELHAALMAAFAQIQERTAGTHASVERINQRLLDAILAKQPVLNVGEGASDAASASGSLVTGVGRALSREVSSQPSEYPPPLAPVVAERERNLLKTLPPGDDMERSLRALSALSDHAIVGLAAAASDFVYFTRPDAAFGPGMSYIPAQDELLKAGLITEVLAENGNVAYALSETGRRVARIMTAWEPLPPDVPAKYRDIFIDYNRKRVARGMADAWAPDRPSIQE